MVAWIGTIGADFKTDGDGITQLDDMASRDYE
jgi:hypothetical protein